MLRLVLCAAAVAFGASACTEIEPRQLDAAAADDAEDGADATVVDPMTVVFERAAAPVPRLTREQLPNAIHAVFGDDVVVPPVVEPDLPTSGYEAIGAGISTWSARGVENLEQIAYAVAEQAVDEVRRGRIVTCEPSGVRDDACAGQVLSSLGERLWRRPLGSEEVAAWVAVAGEAATTLDDFHDGLEFGIAGLIQSPYFVFRHEVGVPDPNRPGVRVFDDWEMAARLSFLLWNTTPDAALLQAAARGELTTEAGLRTQVARMMDDERAREGMRAFFIQMLRLDELSDLTKDPNIFDVMSPEVGPAALEETLRGLEYLVFDAPEEDFRDIVTTRRTFVDRKLASIYGMPAPVRDGFGMTTYPDDQPRRGLLGQLSFLALHAHPVSSSATLRGKFVRETLLCQTVPPPPSDVDTSIPEPNPDARTLRERVASHLENEACSGCHLVFDPIGLAYENFDGIGRFRETDNGGWIDPSGDLDGTAFGDADDLADALREHPRFSPCLTAHIYRYGTGHRDQAAQRPLLGALHDQWAGTGFQFRALLTEFIVSPAFREVAAPALDPPTNDTE